MYASTLLFFVVLQTHSVRAPMRHIYVGILFGQGTQLIGWLLNLDQAAKTWPELVLRSKPRHRIRLARFVR
jgi:hypothetical protein